MLPPKLEHEREQILRVFIDKAPFAGWTKQALELATTESGLDKTMALRAFPSGISDLVAYYFVQADRKMVDALGKYDLETMSIRNRIRTAVIVRIEQKTTHREATKRLIALITTPQYSVTGLRALQQTVDKIWRAAGDQSTDFNFYTKRVLLAAVYTSTLLFWLDDSSYDNSATWKFLDRRINDVMKIQTLRSNLTKGAQTLQPLLSRFFEALNAAR
mgnify:CR=1 FL=1